MPAPTGWADLDIQAALVDLVLHLGGDPIIPIATVTADATAGSLTVTVDSTSAPLPFPQGGILQFDDDLPERFWLISHVVGTVITLSNAGMEQAGLTSTHPAGTRVFCNLFPDLIDPGITDAMLAHGLPVIGFATRQEAKNITTMGGIANAAQESNAIREGVMIVRCSVQIRLQDPGNHVINQAVWALDQIKRQRSIVNRLEDKIIANPLLITTRFESQTRGLGGGGQPAIVKDWTEAINVFNIQIATAYMDITYRTT